MNETTLLEEPATDWATLTGARATTPVEAHPFPSLRARAAEVIGVDGVARPHWVGTDPVLIDYYDQEWGDPVLDEATMFEVLCLFTFQAGLRWRTVLLRRNRLRAKFAGFSVDTLATWGSDDVDRLLEDPSIIRNRRKVESVIRNASATKALRNKGGLVKLVWAHEGEVFAPPLLASDVPTHSPQSAKLARRLKAAGFSSVGPKSCFALMQACGVVDTNPAHAPKRKVGVQATMTHATIPPLE